MPKNLTTTFKNQIKKSSLRACLLVSAEWADGMLYLTNNAKDIEFNGNLYVSAGNLLGIGDIEDTINMTSLQGTISLSGLNQVVQAEAQTQFTNGEIAVYLALLNENDGFIDTPLLLQKGYMNTLASSDNMQDKTSTISVTYTNDFGRFDDIRGRKTNPSEHKLVYVGDTIFDAVPSLSEKMLKW